MTRLENKYWNKKERKKVVLLCRVYQYSAAMWLNNCLLGRVRVSVAYCYTFGGVPVIEVKPRRTRLMGVVVSIIIFVYRAFIETVLCWMSSCWSCDHQ